MKKNNAGYEIIRSFSANFNFKFVMPPIGVAFQLLPLRILQPLQRYSFRVPPNYR